MRGKWGEGELTFKQWHHLYLGLALMSLSWYTGLFIPFVIGHVIFWDDFLQHYIQWEWDKDYVSPLKYIYTKWIWEPLHAHKDI